MTTRLTREDFVARLRGLAPSRRRIVAVAGSPGAGKSTLADWLAEELGRGAPGTAAVLPMDGFHFDDMLLDARGHRPRKGAPHTFDTGGFATTLKRLRESPDEEIAVPVFDRAIEIARAGARIIGPDVSTVVVEGNYLLLDDPAWAPMRRFFDVTAMIEVPEATLRQRLTARWVGYGLAGDALEAKLEGNDLPNMRTVLGRSVAADYTIVA
ncbi:nucleoside/nucleotide kinase family protein [Jiella sonneratiae]|uniref:Nucleoside/nucleotide kinase family protein n=1 Tax=Jiella sonneratiae TaxID=2816856 RepID=A0ABS3J2V1_9HYPH|nr:nucleoside/nucleotide kinase family protein [Jiella sonneratiae]MBO0903989.1 nucleoside/nucleotide kinase family protein [Jiella sonneratiae]